MRIAILGLVMAIPLLGLLMLLARPQLDVRWEHDPTHFWLVLAVAMINVVLGMLTGVAATQRNDARVFLVSLALLSSAGFLALHALATPHVLLDHPNAGFVAATPVGLLLAAGFAAASATALERWGPIALRHQRGIRVGLVLLIAGWGVASLARFTPLDRPLAGEDASVPLAILAAFGVGLYGFAAIRYFAFYHARRRMLPLAIAVAFVLLAEAMIAMAFARSWHATWWEWHVLMLLAFGAITLAARAEYRREGSLGAVFVGVYLQGTLDRLDTRHAEALARLAEAAERGEPSEPILGDLRRQGMSGEEAVALEHSARELRRVNALFRPYVAPRLAERLRRDARAGRLGGTLLEVTVLFADLAGFTTFSEGRGPVEVIDMLNEYWAAAAPIVTQREGGVIERFAGDAIMVVFNALGDQPDHAVRAARAGLALRDSAESLWGLHPSWPRFRIGIQTGPAVVGNVGSEGQRSFAAVGDTTNVAARIQAAATPGEVLIGKSTYDLIHGVARVTALGPVALKGRAEPVPTYRLDGISQ